ncbi:MAG TPA: hypothetical protein ENG85_00040 [Bacteroidetes bacterium]|nr:hypothetical protein [Bacteroidota bacterium]
MTKIVNITLYLKFFRFVFFLFLVFIIQSRLYAQTKNTDDVGILGILMSSDSLHTIPDAQIFSRDNYLGSFSDTNGRFYITVARNDSIMFSSLGYITRIIPITDSILQMKQPITFYMTLDTILIHEIVIHAFWDYETFKQMLIHMKPAQSSYDISEDLNKRPLLYKARQGSFELFSPIQSLYNLLNKKAVIQRRLLHNRKMYNRKMIKLGRPQDTIPSTLDYMRDKIRQ